MKKFKEKPFENIEKALDVEEPITTEIAVPDLNKQVKTLAMSGKSRAVFDDEDYLRGQVIYTITMLTGAIEEQISNLRIGADARDYEALGTLANSLNTANGLLLEMNDKKEKVKIKRAEVRGKTKVANDLVDIQKGKLYAGTMADILKMTDDAKHNNETTRVDATFEIIDEPTGNK